MRNFEIHPEADAEAIAAADWYESEARLGREFLAKVAETIGDICNDPKSHERLRNQIRRRRVPLFPYDVIFRVKKDIVRILAVAHHHREPEYWKHRK